MVAGSLTIQGGHHIDWPVITKNNRLSSPDESAPLVAVYTLKTAHPVS
jgi:hypothetical protein